MSPCCQSGQIQQGKLPPPWGGEANQVTGKKEGQSVGFHRSLYCIVNSHFREPVIRSVPCGGEDLLECVWRLLHWVVQPERKGGKQRCTLYRWLATSSSNKIVTCRYYHPLCPWSPSLSGWEHHRTWRKFIRTWWKSGQEEFLFLSSSSLFSDSVGSIIRAPATGQLIVGAWKPKSINLLAMSTASTPADFLKSRTSMMNSWATCGSTWGRGLRAQ